jgi:hypothetical protein
MNSVCAYLKFDPEVSICAAKNKHRFHIKEVNFIPVPKIRALQTDLKHEIAIISKTAGTILIKFQ